MGIFPTNRVKRVSIRSNPTLVNLLLDSFICFVTRFGILLLKRLVHLLLLIVNAISKGLPVRGRASESSHHLILEALLLIVVQRHPVHHNLLACLVENGLGWQWKIKLGCRQDGHKLRLLSLEISHYEVLLIELKVTTCTVFFNGC